MAGRNLPAGTRVAVASNATRGERHERARPHARDEAGYRPTMSLVLDRPSAIRRAERADVYRSFVLLDALLLAIAAGVHGTLAPEHAREAAALGAGFALTAALQLGAALLLLFRPTPRLFRIVVGVGALALVAWAISRTVGLPFGAEAGSPESAGLVDLGTVAAELTSILVSVALASGRVGTGGPEPLTSIRAALVLVGGFGLYLLVEAQGHAADGDAAAHEAAHLLLAAVIAGAFALVFGVRWLLRSSRRSPAASRA